MLLKLLFFVTTLCRVVNHLYLSSVLDMTTISPLSEFYEWFQYKHFETRLRKAIVILLHKISDFSKLALYIFCYRKPPLIKAYFLLPINACQLQIAFECYIYLLYNTHVLRRWAR